MAKKIDPFPKIGPGKETLRLSATSALRKRPPTNETLVLKGLPNMQFDYTNQMRVWPDFRKDALIEATRAGPDHSEYRTMNRSGHPYALGVNVGGSPDDKGQVLVKAKRRSLTDTPSNGRGKGPKPNVGRV